MHRIIANTLSELRTEWASWRSICSFLAHLNDLDFYKEVDEQREMCIAPWASCREGVHGKQSWPIECVGVTYELTVTELIAGIQADKVTMWIERGSLRYRGLSLAVEKWLPQIRDNREAIAAELRYRGTTPVMSGGCRLGLGLEELEDFRLIEERNSEPRTAVSSLEELLAAVEAPDQPERP